MSKAGKALLDDFKKFRREPSAKARISLVSHICKEYTNQKFKKNEEEVVEEILDFLSRDIEKSIRKALSENLKSCDFAPHEVIMRLASDIEEVSAPVLQFSNVLSDEDLIKIINACEDSSKYRAIASRASVSNKISTKLVDVASEGVISILVNNINATISDASFETITSKYESCPGLLSDIVKRGGLSPTLAEKLIFLVSNELKKELSNTYKLKPSIVEQVINSANEKITLGEVSKNIDRSNTADLIEHLSSGGKLTHSIVLRALCRGDINFFELSIAKLAGVLTYNVHKILYSGNENGFEAVFEAANMPKDMTKAANIVWHLTIENKIHNAPYSQYSRKIVQQIMKNKYDETVPNMRYFLALINNSANSETELTY